MTFGGYIAFMRQSGVSEMHMSIYHAGQQQLAAGIYHTVGFHIFGHSALAHPVDKLSLGEHPPSIYLPFVHYSGILYQH